MNYAVISDIHGNLEALEAVLATIAESEPVLCLGDIVGYGPNPNECISALRARNATCVLGNHDVAAIDDFGTAYFNDNAREAIRWTQKILQPEHRQWLDELAYELRLPEYLLVHGAPVRYFEYCKNIEAAQRAFANTDAPLIFVGHTHIAEYYERQADGVITQTHMQHGGSCRLKAGSRYIINVGSVGQPRDLNPAASFVRYDSDLQSVSWHRAEYAVLPVIDKISAAALPAALGQRLLQGR
jgi:diadenosine tetraphosphatase ApaH/serine/threonine PP2A family protein phosphatase